jgi:methylmalonyl-CoA/ethylmalonyl-CoA epimerase
MIGRLNHVAIAVPDLGAATAFYRDVLGADVSAPVRVTEHGVTSVFVRLPNTTLELITPWGENSPIEKYLTKHPTGGLHHLCFEVEDMQESVEELAAAGVHLVSSSKPGAQGRPVIFVNPKDTFGCLLELEEGLS